MDIVEIILLAAGAAVFVLSFIIPARGEADGGKSDKAAREEIKNLVAEELKSVKGHVDDVVEEAVTYSIEKTERSLERLSNEKIMAVSEYSDTVLAQIHKSHEEVMFLYDMLNDKHTNLKNTVSEVNRTVREVAETTREAEEVVSTFQRLAPETLTAAAMPEPLFRAQAVISTQPIGAQTAISQPSIGIQAADGLQTSGDQAVMEQAVRAQTVRIPVAAEQAARAQAMGMAVEHGGRVQSDVPPVPSEQAAGVKSVPPVVSKEPVREPAASSNTISFTQEKDRQGRNFNDRIMELYREGKSKVAIAKELNLGVGEVKLVIDLYKNL